MTSGVAIVNACVLIILSSEKAQQRYLDLTSETPPCYLILIKSERNGHFPCIFFNRFYKDS